MSCDVPRDGRSLKPVHCSAREHKHCTSPCGVLQIIRHMIAALVGCPTQANLPSSSAAGLLVAAKLQCAVQMYPDHKVAVNFTQKPGISIELKYMSAISLIVESHFMALNMKVYMYYLRINLVKLLLLTQN